jgi:hypothetical protein
MQFHPPKWLIYLAIVVGAVLFGLFMITVITNIYQTKNAQSRQQIEVVKQAAGKQADSLSRVIKVEKTIQDAKVESLAERVIAVKANAIIEKTVLHKQYEKLFKQVECYSDDSISRIYEQLRNQPKYDTLLSK